MYPRGFVATRLVAAPPAPPPDRVSLRLRYRDVIGLVAMQSFGNQMAGSFWVVYLVSPPRSVPFVVAALLWFVAYLTAIFMVLLMGRVRPVRGRRAIVAGLLVQASGHLSFVVLPAELAVFVGGFAFGVALPLFWLPTNCLVVGATSSSNRGARLAGVTATFTTIAVVAPVIGGIVAGIAGYPVLFLLGGAIVAGSVVLALRHVERDVTFAFPIDRRRMSTRTALAFWGQGGTDGLLSVATPLGSFLFTSSSVGLGILFASFSLAAGVAAILVGRASDRAKTRTPFLLLGPLLSVPACLLAFRVGDLGTFAFAVGWLSMTSSLAPSLIYTILIDRTADSIPSMTATRELFLNLGRTLVILTGLVVLSLGGDVYALYVIIGAVILLEMLAR